MMIYYANEFQRRTNIILMDLSTLTNSKSCFREISSFCVQNSLKVRLQI